MKTNIAMLAKEPRMTVSLLVTGPNAASPKQNMPMLPVRLSLSVSVRIVSFFSASLVTDRQCTTERWTRELLVDGCLSYMKSYWCMCSSDMCNGGDLDSIRGKPKSLFSGGEFEYFSESRIWGLLKESVSRWNDLSGYEGRIYVYLCSVARRLHTM